MRAGTETNHRTPSAILCFVLLCAASCVAQVEEQKSELGFPRVAFELDWAQADPHWYRVEVDSQGRSAYKSQPRVAADETPDEPYSQEFTMNPKTAAHIFELADSVNHFQGNFDYKGSTKMAQTGKKTLSYQTAGNNQSTSYNWSENKQIMELTDIFQGISLTIESGRELRHAQRFDKLGVDAILKRLEEFNKDHRLIELQAIAPILQRIADDRLCMNIARQRARRLLASVEAAK